MIGSPQRHADRELGESPRRSRRCEGSCSFAEDHWPRGREGGGGGSPESEDLPRRRTNPEPLAEGVFVFKRLIVLAGVALLACALAAPALALRVKVQIGRASCREGGVVSGWDSC